MNRRIFFIVGGLFLAAVAVSSLTSSVAWHWGGLHKEVAVKREMFGHGPRWAERHDFGPFGGESESAPAQPAPPEPPMFDGPFGREVKPAPGQPVPPEPAVPSRPFGPGDKLERRWIEHGPGHPFGLPVVLRILANIAVLFGLGLLLRTLAPQRLSTMLAALDAPPSVLLRHGVTGLATLLVTGALAVLAAISILAIPLVPLLAFGVAVCALLGVSTVAAALGRHLRARSDALEPNPNADLLLGLLVFGLLALVPGLNMLVLGVAALLGLGVVVVTRGGTSASVPPETTEL